MGMSEDFEGAIAMGSGEVRGGSTIFGQRPCEGGCQAHGVRVEHCNDSVYTMRRGDLGHREKSTRHSPILSAAL